MIFARRFAAGRRVQYRGGRGSGQSFCKAALLGAARSLSLSLAKCPRLKIPCYCGKLVQRGSLWHCTVYFLIHYEV